ncbi:MAG: hypothetical protein CVV24_10690 [Ignavibacteriae bacterium HGW-Ignavibacteriae-3]|nr:MAG: hypothetical protein CVV24_10690 [Ignavibacteriae bacterium HGW-Ignavibacteriae-3]
MIEMISAILPFFIIMGLGAGIAPFIEREKWIEVLNKYGLFIGFPAIILASLTKVRDYSTLDLRIIYANISILLISIALILFISKIARLSKEIRNTYMICSFWGNVAYLGFPLLSGLYPDSKNVISVIIAVYIIVVFTVGVIILEISQNEKSIDILLLLKNLLKNPLLLSVLAAIALVKFDIMLPKVLQTSIDMFAASASPVVLLSLGIFISRKIQFNKNFIHSAFISSYKLILLPLIFILILQFFNFSKIDSSISIMESAMPLAITPFALAEIYPLDKEIISMAVIISTMLSLFTLIAISVLIQ